MMFMTFLRARTVEGPGVQGRFYFMIVMEWKHGEKVYDRN